MKCPDCATPLQLLFIERGETLSDVRVDRCATCGGLWFEVGELEQAVARLVPVEALHAPTDRHCPACGPALETVLLPGAVPAETCGSCKGIWLDRGELRELGGKEPRRAVPRAPAAAAGDAVGADGGRAGRSRAPPPRRAEQAPEPPGGSARVAAFDCAKCGRRTPLNQANGTSYGLVCRACTPQVQVAPEVPDVDLLGLDPRRRDSSSAFDLDDLLSFFF